MLCLLSLIVGYNIYIILFFKNNKWDSKKKNNPKEDSSRSDDDDAGSVVTTSSPVPQVKVKRMAIMMIQGQVEGTPVD